MYFVHTHKTSPKSLSLQKKENFPSYLYLPSSTNVIILITLRLCSKIQIISQLWKSLICYSGYQKMFRFTAEIRFIISKFTNEGYIFICSIIHHLFVHLSKIILLNLTPQLMKNVLFSIIVRLYMISTGNISEWHFNIQVTSTEVGKLVNRILHYVISWAYTGKSI